MHQFVAYDMDGMHRDGNASSVRARHAHVLGAAAVDEPFARCRRLYHSIWEEHVIGYS